ncbi:MAG: diphosphate--fructose-6-phosphate 1-phosphotransferase [Phycisphaerae bacterium]|jgi:6-phosphofructokinase 1
MKKNINVLVAQSGGPTPVINNSLRGVIETCRNYPSKFGKIYAGWHGVEGVLQEELIDISAQPQKEIDLLATTPAAGAIGTCRYKLSDDRVEDFERIIEVLKAHNIGYFFYIGGNDSMDTANKVSNLAKEKQLDLTVVGIPKTVDNDLGDQKFTYLDHTPGYGSIARYWAYLIQNANQESLGCCTHNPVIVLEAMGRGTGFIPAAARLGDPNREMPLHLYLPESKFTLEEIADTVSDELKQSPRCIVLVNRGQDFGAFSEKRDAFGHTDGEDPYGRTNSTIVTHYLNSKKLSKYGPAWCNVSGLEQRMVSVLASNVDIEEAFLVARHAVEVALKDGTGWMSTIERRPGDTYEAYYDKVSLPVVANSVREVPHEWITESRYDVTDDFVKYAKPLIGDDWVKVPLEGGIQRFARFKKIFAEKRCKEYVPMMYRP